VHKDLKPAHVLVNCTDGQARLHADHGCQPRAATEPPPPIHPGLQRYFDRMKNATGKAVVRADFRFALAMLERQLKFSLKD
jgi:hypothetical protein